MDNSSRYRVAVHEAGHVLLGLRYEGFFTLDGANIANASSGYVTRRIFDAGKQTKKANMQSIQISYGGIAAEHLIFQDGQDGGSGDIEQINRLACMQVLGKLDEEFSVFYLYDDEYNTPKNEKKREALKKKCYKAAYAYLKSHRKKLERVAKALSDKGYLTRDEIYAL